MSVSPDFKLIIHFNDSDFSPEERDEQAQRLLAELRDMDEIESASRVLDPSPPKGNKAVGGFLIGLLTAKINSKNAMSAFAYLQDRLSGKSIELEVEANGKRLKVSASSRAELEAAIQAAHKFVSL